MSETETTGFNVVPVVIALFNGNHDEDPMCIPTKHTLIWDENRRQIVISLAVPNALQRLFLEFQEDLDEAFALPSPCEENTPGPVGWIPPGWNEESA